MLPPPPWIMDRYSPYDRPPYDLMDRPHAHMAGQPYGRMLGYDPYMHHPPAGYSRYSERAVFDYSDRRDAGRYGDRPLYDSTESGSRPQVVDYNHGSISASSTDERDVEKDRKLPPPPVAPASGRDVDARELAADGTESRPRSSHSPERSAPVFDADVDIKFIQDTIVSLSHCSMSLSVLESLCLNVVRRPASHPQCLCNGVGGVATFTQTRVPSPGFRLRVVCHSYKLHPHEWSVRGHLYKHITQRVSIDNLQ